MGKGKTIGIVVGGLVLAIIIAGVLGYSMALQDKTPIQQQTITSSPSIIATTNLITGNTANNNKPKLITTSIDNLFPTRRDIGTEWTIDPQTHSRYGLDNATGLIEATQQTFSKYTDRTNLGIGMVRFDTIEHASEYYKYRIATIYAKGGYKEYKITSNIDSDCYGTIYHGMYTDKLDIYCVKFNIYDHIATTSILGFDDSGNKAIDNMQQVITSNIASAS